MEEALKQAAELGMAAFRKKEPEGNDEGDLVPNALRNKFKIKLRATQATRRHSYDEEVSREEHRVPRAGGKGRCQALWQPSTCCLVNRALVSCFVTLVSCFVTRVLVSCFVDRGVVVTTRHTTSAMPIKSRGSSQGVAYRQVLI